MRIALTGNPTIVKLLLIIWGGGWGKSLIPNLTSTIAFSYFTTPSSFFFLTNNLTVKRGTK